MKISERTHPVLKMLKEGKIGRASVYPEDKKSFIDTGIYLTLSDIFKQFHKYYVNNVYNISTNFGFSILQSMPQMLKDEVWDDIDIYSGTILNMPPPFSMVSCLYYIRGTELKSHHDRVLFYFIGDTICGYSANVVSDNRYECILSEVLINSIKGDEFIGMTKKEKMQQVDNLLYSTIVSVENFIRYANVETKFIEANSKKIDNYFKCVNESNSDIKIYDSKWFTNIVNQNQFNVRGHFRLQPKKDDKGNWTKELIWINEFTKNGYTSKAKILA